MRVRVGVRVGVRVRARVGWPAVTVARSASSELTKRWAVQKSCCLSQS